LNPNGQGGQDGYNEEPESIAITSMTTFVGVLQRKSGEG